MKTSLFLATMLLYFNTTVAQTVSTFAGQAAQGSTDGTGTAAQFYSPHSLATDASGNFYVGDAGNNLIRKITPAGEVTTLAGSGAVGSTDGIGTAAQFKSPFGVATDASGNVYVTDTYNHRIRKITPAGEVTTLAGTGTAGSTDGIGTVAQFSYPSGVATDTAGNIYVGDQGNNRIRKITSTGVVSTLAGQPTAGSTDGTGTAAKFNNPSGVALDTSGNVYVADTTNNKIRKITPAGGVTTLAGQAAQGSANGTGAAAQFNGPYFVTLDASGNVYAADNYNNLIRKITAGGVVTTLAGQPTAGFADGTGTAAQFNNPFGVVTDTSGNVYVGDAGNNRVRKITLPTLEINENSTNAFNISLYPNPAATILNVKVDKIEAGTLLTIIDVLGKTIYTQPLTNTLTTVNTSAFSKGVYFVTIHSPGKKTVTKFLVN